MCLCGPNDPASRPASTDEPIHQCTTILAHSVRHAPAIDCHANCLTHQHTNRYADRHTHQHAHQHTNGDTYQHTHCYADQHAGAVRVLCLTRW